MNIPAPSWQEKMHGSTGTRSFLKVSEYEQARRDYQRFN